MVLLSQFFPMTTIILLGLIVAVILIVIQVVKQAKKIWDYRHSTYYKITKNSYYSVHFDIGRLGEYCTYDRLKHYESAGAKFLFNIYVPKENGETTEIDLMMICKKGVFVLESKNYSGWIFGSENQVKWHQTLPVGRGRSQKEHFYNPIMQNRTHIKHLKALLGEQIPMQSIIVFSNRCTLKRIELHSDDVAIVKRCHVSKTISNICKKIPKALLTESQIEEIYNKLYPFTQVGAVAKKQHVANIQHNLHPAPQVQATPSKPAKEAPTEEEKPTPEIPALQELRCPKCNGKLILRTATRGANVGNQFYGCENYPKCKYIQNITKHDVNDNKENPVEERAATAKQEEGK